MPSHQPPPLGQVLAACIILVGAAVWLVLQRRRPREKTQEPDAGWAFGLPYAFGAASCAFGALPEPQWRRPVTEGGPAFATVVLCVGVGLLLVGLVVHLRLRARGRLQDGASERASVLAALLVGAAAAGRQLLTRSGVGVEPWVLRGAMVILAILVVLALALIVFRLRCSPVSRVARLVAEGRHIDAIALAHAVPERERDAVWQHNLAAAYYGAGEAERAAMPWPSLRSTSRRTRSCIATHAAMESEVTDQA